jgi:hypothetical protein
MKKLLLIAAIIVIAAPAHAQLFMAWNACDGTAGSSTARMSFDCRPGSDFTAELWGTFGLPGTTLGVVAVDGTIDLTFQYPQEISPFWHFEPGGCNSSGIGMTIYRGSSSVPCKQGNSTLLCGVNGEFCSGGIGSYEPGFGGYNRARLSFSIARPDTNPQSLPGVPTRVFGFRLKFTMGNTPGSGGGDCTGCETATVIRWSRAVVWGNSSGQRYLAAIIDAATPGSTDWLLINDAFPVPVQAKSWGQLKALYR